MSSLSPNMQSLPIRSHPRGAFTTADGPTLTCPNAFLFKNIPNTLYTPAHCKREHSGCAVILVLAKPQGGVSTQEEKETALRLRLRLTYTVFHRVQCAPIFLAQTVREKYISFNFLIQSLIYLH